MKQIGCLCLLLMFLTGIAYSKERMGIDLGIGLKGGLNFNKVVAKEWKDQFSTDPHAGFFLFINKHRLGVHLEVNWSQNQLTTDSSFYGLYKQYYANFSDSLNQGTFRFSTISIPILLNLKLTQFLWLQGGPQYTSGVGFADKNKILKSGVEIIREGNFNLVGGLWLQLGGRNSLIRINAGVRYISGITNMSNLQTISGENADWRNQMIQVHLGLNY